MAFAFINNVVGQSQEMGSMHSKSSVVTLMNSISMSIGLMNCTNHMEMNGISSDLESLTDICELSVGQSTSERVVTF